MFKVALNAGHYMGQEGKRCLASIDAKETREWWLNDRICGKVEMALALYDDCILLRTDDTSGQKDILLADRVRKANEFEADVYISIHHNAGQNGESGGGIVVYTSNQADESTKQLQRLCYDKLIAATGLTGNRAEPLATADFSECSDTNMPAVLIECGFLDSTTDTPLILSEEFASHAAGAIAEAIAEFGALQKKAEFAEEIDDVEDIDLEQNVDAAEDSSFAPAMDELSVFGIVMNGRSQSVKENTSLFSKKIGLLSSGEKVKVIERIGNNYKIEFNGKTAFTNAKNMVISGNL